MISRCSVILTHLLDRLVFGDSHDFLLFEHKVSQAERDEQPLEKLNEAVRLSHPGIVEPGAVEAAVLAEVFDAVRLKSCGGVDLGLSHVSSLQLRTMLISAPGCHPRVMNSNRLCRERECLSVPAHFVSLL